MLQSSIGIMSRNERREPNNRMLVFTALVAVMLCACVGNKCIVTVTNCCREAGVVNVSVLFC